MTREQFMTSLRTRLEERNKTGYTLYFRLETFGRLMGGRTYAMVPDVLDSTTDYILDMAGCMFLHPEETEFFVFDPKRMLSWHVANEDGEIRWYQHPVRNDWVIRDCAKHCAL